VLLILFANPDQLAAFLHLDPTQLSEDEAFCMVRLLSDAQVEDEAFPLKFSLMVETLNTLDRGGDIGHLVDAPPSLSPTKTTYSCDMAMAKADPAAAGDRSISPPKPTSVEKASGDTITNDRTSSVVSGLSVDAGAETTDGDTVTNDGNSSVVLGVSVDAGVETADGKTATNDGQPSAVSGVPVNVGTETADGDTVTNNGLPVQSPVFPWTWKRVSIILPRSPSRIAAMMRDLQIVFQVSMLIIVVYKLG